MHVGKLKTIYTVYQNPDGPGLPEPAFWLTTDRCRDMWDAASVASMMIWVPWMCGVRSQHANIGRFLPSGFGILAWTMNALCQETQERAGVNGDTCVDSNTNITDNKVFIVDTKCCTSHVDMWKKEHPCLPPSFCREASGVREVGSVWTLRVSEVRSAAATAALH